MIRIVLVALLAWTAAFAADLPPVHASEDADSVQLDNGVIALSYSKQSGTFTAIRRHRNGRRECPISWRTIC